MSGTSPIVLSGRRVQASVRAREGAVVDSLLVDGRPVLARTPWAEAVAGEVADLAGAGAGSAVSEADWVARWRGGWQLCFPTSGQPDPDAAPPQGFHGTASQAPWEVVEAAADRVHLRWQDELGLTAERTWRLTRDGIAAGSSAVNRGPSARTLAVAEHLVLGGDVLAPVVAGSALTVDVPAGSRLAPLDYDGRPAGPPAAWPADAGARWQTVDAATPARVAALLPAAGPAGGALCVMVAGPHVQAVVTWSGLPHALLWEELGASQEPPWNGAVVALGIEPTSTPHGVGTRGGHGTVTLAPGARMAWQAALAVRWVAA